MLRLKLIACKALFRECSLLAVQTDNIIDATFMRQGLHDTPVILHSALQQEIDLIDNSEDIHSYKPQLSKDFDAILLGYGLCSNAIAGLSSKRYPLIIPRCDDCISLFLGSYDRYREFFDKYSGTFWYNASWIENAYTPSEQNNAALLIDYTERFGEDNAKYLLETESAVKNYSRCAYIEWNELHFPQHIQYAKKAAQYFGWNFDLVTGDKSFLQALFEGNWDEKQFLTVPPGRKVKPDYNGHIICTE